MRITAWWMRQHLLAQNAAARTDGPRLPDAGWPFVVLPLRLEHHADAVRAPAFEPDHREAVEGAAVRAELHGILFIGVGFIGVPEADEPAARPQRIHPQSGRNMGLGAGAIVDAHQLPFPTAQQG